MKTRLIFETVKKHLLSQMEPSMDSHSMGLYRGYNGLACAIGCLISDRYRPNLEMGSVFDPRVLAAIDDVYEVSLDKDDSWFLDRLQSIHDREPVHMWESKLAEFEERYIN
jgi:hypothetical protein